MESLNFPDNKLPPSAIIKRFHNKQFPPAKPSSWFLLLSQVSFSLCSTLTRSSLSAELFLGFGSLAQVKAMTGRSKRILAKIKCCKRCSQIRNQGLKPGFALS